MRSEYLAAGLEVPIESGPGSLQEIQLLRFLVDKLGATTFFMSDQELGDSFSDCPKMSRLLQTAEWQHPDVAGGEKPSESVSIRSLLDAIETGSPMRFQPGRANTDWKLWEQMD